MKREYKKSRMLFQLVVYHLLLSDLERDPLARKIFTLVFGKAAFDEHLRAKSNWDSDLEDFAGFALEHLVRAIGLLGDNEFSLTEILGIKFPIAKAAKVEQKANLLLKKRDYQGSNLQKRGEGVSVRPKKGIIFAILRV